MIRESNAVAGEDIPVGCYVRLSKGAAFLDPSLTGRGGIARGLPSGVVRKGDPLRVLTDGGIQARLLADAEIVVRGVSIRLLASDQHYLHLSQGRVVGFLGDDRMGL